MKPRRRNEFLNGLFVRILAAIAGRRLNPTPTSLAFTFLRVFPQIGSWRTSGFGVGSFDFRCELKLTVQNVGPRQTVPAQMARGLVAL